MAEQPGQAASAPAPATADSPTPLPDAPPRAKLPPLQDADVRKALQGVAILLDQGEEARARAELARLLDSNPDSPLAQLFMRQITEDPGTYFFGLLKNKESYSYTVAQGETLSTIARSRLNDPNLFYVLARYNSIGQPNKLHAGQKITIPGKPSVAIDPRPTQATAAATPPPVTPPPTPPTPPKPSPGEQAMSEARAAEKAGKLDAAYDSYVLAFGYGLQEAQQKVDETRKRAVDAHSRSALQALLKDNDPVRCMKEWDRVLRLEPNNDYAKLNRQKCSKVNCTLHPDKCEK